LYKRVSPILTGKEFPKIEDNYEKVLSPQTAYQVTSILQGVVERGTGKKLNKFLNSSDIVVSILPDTEKTKNFINKKFLSLMKKNSFLINIGRGSTLNEQDLLLHLNKNKSFHVSLDVFKIEPLPKKNKFWTHKNVIITPHAAALTNIDS